MKDYLKLWFDAVTPVRWAAAGVYFGLFAGLAGIPLAEPQGKGGGGSSGWIENFDDSLAAVKSRGWGIEQTGAPDSAYGIPGVGGTKSYDASNVTIDQGKLKLRLNLYNDGSALRTVSEVRRRSANVFSMWTGCDTRLRVRCPPFCPAPIPNAGSCDL